jgi:hypothetical protein
MRLVESMWVQKEMPQHGTNTAGEAMMVGTADGFLTPPKTPIVDLSICGHQRWRGFQGAQQVALQDC